MPVIGYLGTQSADVDYKNVTAPFLQGLKEAGFVEGQNVAIEYRAPAASRSGRPYPTIEDRNGTAKDRQEQQDGD